MASVRFVTVSLAVALVALLVCCFQARPAEAQCEHLVPGYSECTWCCTHHDSRLVWDMDTQSDHCNCIENPASNGFRHPNDRVGWFF